jgi:hypothetical protein
MRKLTLKFHWPHDRFALGWEVFYPDEEFETTEFILFLGIVTVELEF